MTVRRKSNHHTSHHCACATSRSSQLLLTFHRCTNHQGDFSRKCQTLVVPEVLAHCVLLYSTIFRGRCRHIHVAIIAIHTYSSYTRHQLQSCFVARAQEEQTCSAGCREARISQVAGQIPHIHMHRLGLAGCLSGLNMENQWQKSAAETNHI